MQDHGRGARGSRAARALGGVCLLFVAVHASAADPPLEFRFDNGIEATIYPPEYILEHMITVRPAGRLLRIDNVQYTLVTDINDPIVSNKGDGRFHPIAVDDVVEAMREIQIDNAQIRVRIYLLPYPRREILDSSARGDVVMLTPGVREVSEQTVHFTVTHEIGHIYQYRWMPDNAIAHWESYAGMRGIEDRSIYNSAAVHRNRPHEVFAEDFRFLFGGTLSTMSGTIENHELPLPTEVAGLSDFILALPEARRASAARLLPTPNPFNPSTEIRVELGQDPRSRNVTLRVFDAQGRPVRRLYQGPAASRHLRVSWDGRRESGVPTPSGVYFARLDFAGATTTTKLMLLK
ncbi:MAG: T9SS type A sorting domain-containing protein [Candidatus Latescibacterota bacterium]|nr:MAG: T9SS type A sorting domain-containing protein [Candidatus Latescibacterota bacterium]